MEERCKCGGALRKKKVNLDLWKEEKLSVLKSMPAMVCEQCGEKYFSSRMLGAIEKLLMENSKRDENSVFMFCA